MIPYVIAFVGSYLIGESMQSEDFADGGGVSSKDYQIKKSDGTFFYLKMSTGAPAWSTSADMGYQYTKSEAERIKAILENEGATGLSVIKYDKDWWKNAPDFADGGKAPAPYENMDFSEIIKSYDYGKSKAPAPAPAPYENLDFSEILKNYSNGGSIKKNFKPALEFDKKYGTSISKTDWKFPDNYSADYVYEKIITPMFKKNVGKKKEEYFYNYLEKLEEGNYFPYDFDRLIGKNYGSSFEILYGMVSGFNYDDIVYFVEGWTPIYSTKNGQLSRKRVEKELTKLGVDDYDIQWIISPKTFEKIKKQLTNPRKDLFGKTLAKGGQINPYEQFLLDNGFVKGIERKKEGFVQYRKGRWYCWIDNKTKEVEVGKFSSDVGLKDEGWRENEPFYHTDRYTNSFSKFKKFLDDNYILDFAKGGEIKWQDIEVGDSARVKDINKTGVIVKTYGRKFHLKFVDGTEKTYDATELEFFKN